MGKRIGRKVGRKPKKNVYFSRKNTHILKRDLFEAIGISETAVCKYLKTLKAKGLLQRIGTNKNGYWQILS